MGHSISRLLDDADGVDTFPSCVDWEQASILLENRLAILEYRRKVDNERYQRAEQARLDRLVAAMRRQTQVISPVVKEKAIELPPLARKILVFIGQRQPRKVSMRRSRARR